MTPPPTTPVFLPAGVADPEGRTGYFAAGPAGILALDLASGALLWQSGAGSRPLLVAGDFLIAQSPVPGHPNLLRIAWLNPAQGGAPELVSQADILPAWVDTGSPRPEAFQIRARLDGETVVLDWEAHARYQGGAPPSREILRQANRDAAGTVRIGSQTGEIEPAAPDFPANPPSTYCLRESASPPNSPEILWQTEPWNAGSGLASLAIKEAHEGQSLVLQTSGGSPRESGRQVELAHGAGLAPSLSHDGRTIFVEPDLPAGEQRSWWVFASETGERIASIPHEEEAREPSLVGPRAFYLAPGPAQTTVLRARDVASGELLWERALTTSPAGRTPHLPQ